MNIARMYLANLLRLKPSPRLLSAAERASMAELHALVRETYDHEAPIVREWTLPSGRHAVVRGPQPDISGELAFRQYARRSGARVCPGDHENLRGVCPECRASV